MKNNIRRQKTLVLNLLIFSVEITPHHLMHLKKLWCDSLTNIPERDLEACATLEMKERELGTTYMDARYNSLRERCFAPEHDSKDTFQDDGDSWP